jgi:hypothetical protein
MYFGLFPVVGHELNMGYFVFGLLIGCWPNGLFSVRILAVDFK